MALPRMKPAKPAASAGPKVGYPTAVVRNREARQKVDPAVVQRRILTALGVMLALSFLLALYTSPWLYVRRIEMRGLEGLAVDEINDLRARAQVPPRTNLILAPLRRVEQALEQAPAVEHAEVGRWPMGTLRVRIYPRQPAAVLTIRGDRWELDGHGLVIRRERPGHPLPEIAVEGPLEVEPGRPTANPAVDSALRTLEWARKGGAPAVSKIAIDQSGELCLNMNDGVAVRLGHEDELYTKLSLLKKVYQGRPDIAAEVAEIDLRFPTAPACTPRGRAEAKAKTGQTPHDTKPRDRSAEAQAAAQRGKKTEQN